MKPNDSQLKEMFVQATDEVIPRAPWLEAQVVDAVQQRGRVPNHWGGFKGLSSGLRLTAGLAALLIAAGTVAVLLMSSRLLHNPTMPGGSATTVHSPLPSPPFHFRPSPTVRASNWPPGGPVPGALTGGWKPTPYTRPYSALYMANYSWQIGDDTAISCGPDNCGFGNVVVNGSEIDFIDVACTVKADFGFERFTYVLTGNTLVLTRAPGPGQSLCGWSLAGTYSRVP